MEIRRAQKLKLKYKLFTIPSCDFLYSTYLHEYLIDFCDRYSIRIAIARISFCDTTFFDKCYLCWFGWQGVRGAQLISVPRIPTFCAYANTREGNQLRLDFNSQYFWAVSTDSHVCILYVLNLSSFSHWLIQWYRLRQFPGFPFIIQFHVEIKNVDANLFRGLASVWKT